MAKAWRLEGAPLDASSPVAEAARRLLACKLAEVRHHAERTVRREDPEDLHALRVATRRLRAALSLVGGPLDDLREGVKRLGAALGRLRDRDVLLGWVEAELAAARDDEWPGIERFGELERVDLPSLEQLVRDALAAFEAHVAQPLALRLGEAGFDEPLGGRRVRRRLSQRLAKLDRVGRELGARRHALADVATVHALRIDAKKLRYELELVEDVLDGAAEAIDAIKPLQQAIGDLHDADVRQALLVPFVAAAPRFEQPGAVRLLRETLAGRRAAEAGVTRLLAEWQRAPLLAALAARLGEQAVARRREA